jgi:hypothetical protein
LALVLSWTAVASATVAADAKADAQWIGLAQLSDGAIANYTDRVSIWPYEGSYAAWGLATLAAQTGDLTKADQAWRWLSWYMRHQDRNGFVQNYQVQSGREINTGFEDSTDATAGVFLEAALAAYLVKPTVYASRLATLHPAIRKAVAAIEATVDADGLSWAKPTLHVKYLMDNTEAWGGLLAAVRLATFLGDGALATRAGRDAERERVGIESLWNPKTNTYNWAKHENGHVETTNWSIFYPDSVEETWVAAYGEADPARAAAIMATFASAHPNWDQPRATVSYWDGTVSPHAVGYWPVVGWAFLRVGDTARAQKGAANIRAAALASNRAWPFTTGNAGELINLELGVAPS